MTFDGYISACAVASRTMKYWRSGQVYFNVLSDIRPDLSEQIRGWNLDPFHMDSVLPNFLEWVAANWELKSNA